MDLLFAWYDHLVVMDIASVLQVGLLGRLALAALLGGAIGAEREWRGKAAGLRTTILICVGSALLTEISMYAATLATGPVGGDPARISAQIVSGIGWIGGAVVFKSSQHVSGLTTAATIWVVAAIGMAVGSGAYVAGIGATLFVLFVLMFLRRFDRLLARGPKKRFMDSKFTRRDQPYAWKALSEMLGQEGIEHGFGGLHREEREVSVRFWVRIEAGDAERIMMKVLALEGCLGVR